MPQGIVADFDGNAWFCESGLGSDRIGRIDAQTAEIAEFPTPTPDSGPRGLWFDSIGILWITESRANKLARFDPPT